MRLPITLFLLHAALTLAVPSPERTLHFGSVVSHFAKLSDTTVRQSGLNFSPCIDDSSCVGDRICVTKVEEGVVPCISACFCLPRILNPSTIGCTTSADCDSGESCISGQEAQVCVGDDVTSAANVDTSDGDDDVDGDVIDGTGVDGNLKPASSGRGLTGDACSSDDECTAPRMCSPSPNGGFCNPPIPTTCDSAEDCVDGEVCVALELGIICVSEAVVDANRQSSAPSSTNPDAATDAPVTTVATTTATDDQATTIATVAPSTTDIANPAEATTDDEESSTNNPILGGTGSGACDNGDTEGQSGENEESSEGEDTTPSGLTLDPCQNSDGCAGLRTCQKGFGEEECTDGGDDCRCIPAIPIPCSDDAACVAGEGCFETNDIIDIPFLPDDVLDIPSLPDELKDVKFCISKAARDDAVCIASHSLAHISREQLVFEKDAVAHVLCDVNDSCATPGHMVQYKGEGMMMKSYCELTSCVRKVMKVNSPKYSRGLTVPSHTEDLVFTALAARFQTRGEEGVLSAAVRFGF